MKSYEIERRPIAIRNTSAAQATAHQVGDIPIGDHILDESEQGASERAMAGQALSKLTEEFASIGIQLGARYDNSPVIVGDGRAPSDRFYEYIPSASPGGRTPHYWLPNRVSIFDLFGKGFTLLCFRQREREAGGMEATAIERQIPFKVLPIHSDEARELYESDFALIRPDQHVAWRGDSLPVDCRKLLATVSGQADDAVH